ncbi:MAG: 23S rRNA (adenine(2503)-C(2))-methyltransferase RlmN [Demequinaceae bacterium]|nr:23S rRNA (adenine(2503)-C(2))-methyltransferase RlmN [Demequinaceae bacterium]
MSGEGSIELEAPRRGRPPRHFAGLTPDERVGVVEGLGQPAFRAKQLATHYFTHLTTDPADLTDIPAEARLPLVSALFPPLLEVVRRVGTDDGTTVKTLWSLHDGARIESLFMAYPERATLCVTSQVGCGMGCPFCATGQMGLTRNLGAAEIVEQVRLTARTARDGEAREATRLSHVVFMGMGEPLANYTVVLGSIRTLIAPTPRGFGLSARHITVSTVGLVPAIDRLAAEGLPLTLALSLHAPDDTLRDELVPINSRWKVDEALYAAYRYFEATHRRVSIEYALMRGINDQEWRAELLAEKLVARGRAWVHVNPIPLNPTPGSKWTASTPSDQATFVHALEEHAIPVTIRDTRGSDIDGACGQLATKEAS